MSPRRTRKLTLDRLLESAETACFVAMDFSAKSEHVFSEIFAPAIYNSGLLAIRSDHVLSAAGNVVEEIIKIIQAARIILIDITGLNANVLIELGIAQALNRPIILVTQDATVPFDIQPKRIIRYNLSTAGKRQLREELELTVASSVYPPEAGLRSMFPISGSQTILILHGAASEQHIDAVYPPVSASYYERLLRHSSETSGIWDISVAFQRMNVGRRESSPRLLAADATKCGPEILGSTSLICLGGPAANPIFGRVCQDIEKRFVNSLSMTAFDAPEGRKRYRITLGGRIFPPDQDVLLDSGIDFGVVIRVFNPEKEGAFIWLAAGIRAFGTEGAIRALTTPALIKSIFDRIAAEGQTLRREPKEAEFGAIIRVDFDQDRSEVENVAVHSAFLLEPHRV